jgi:outer membrane protein OmpA-like peptidoglycan-associated protein
MSKTNLLIQKPAPDIKSKGRDNYSSSQPSQCFFIPGLNTPQNSRQIIIQPKLEISQPGDMYEREADTISEKVMTKSEFIAPSTEEEEEKLQAKPLSETISRMIQTSRNENSDFQNTGMEDSLNSSKSSGNPLSGNVRSFMENRFGTDFSNVKIHTDSNAVQMSKMLNAHAFTHGNNIYFNSGKYDPVSSTGQYLLAHELTHTIQQGGAVKPKMIQRAIAGKYDTTFGEYDVSTTAHNGALDTPATTQASLDIAIQFTPKTTAPYSNEIKLIQIVKLRDTSGNDVDNISSLPAGRGASLRTTTNTATGVEGGFFTDVLHQNFNSTGPTTVTPPRTAKGTSYEGASPVYGFKRSDDKRDIKAARITDTPGTSGNMDFTFETVAKGEDTNQVYGSFHWAFSARNGSITNDTASVANVQSATFDAALEKHRDFYVHEPVIFYFGFNEDIVTTTEAAKIDSFLAYLRRSPDVRLSLEGFADQVGDSQYNLDLSMRRTENVKRALIAKGIDESKIIIQIGWGKTNEFTSGNLAPNAGRSQALEANRRGNRRVVLTFEHTT